MKQNLVFNLTGDIVATVIDGPSVEELTRSNLVKSGVKAREADALVEELHEWIRKGLRPGDSRDFKTGKVAFNVKLEDRTPVRVRRPSTEKP